MNEVRDKVKFFKKQWNERIGESMNALGIYGKRHVTRFAVM